MSVPEELLASIDRILNGHPDDADWLQLQQLRLGAVASGSRSVAINQSADGAIITTGDGNHILNIVFQANGLRVGERDYQGDGAEILRSLLQEILKPKVEIDWPKVSRILLDHQIERLTSNPLTHNEGIAYRTEQVYVPLGLVERKKVSRRREDVSPEQGSLLYEETEITQKFEQGVFLEQVLRQGQSPRSGGQRIAVIGEPGAGKTTLLQQMARWVAEHIEGAISIWVSLADLQGRSLEDYLLEQWLLAAVQQQGQAEAATQAKAAFVALFQAGRVWLWLDGVDEMPVAAGNPLGEMERQVRLGGLLTQARILLTCRLNLWDGDRHALDTFDVYRTLEFAYPRQVEQFVGQWFGALPEAQGEQAERLCGALRQPGKERLRDLVKNPLRLTLLCFNWYLGEGMLPETKAGLYEQFVADFYEWKREQFPTTAEQRRRLNAALGELAREAIDKEETRFRLRHDFVCKYLGEMDEPDSLFQIALRLGWLNQIGVDAENRRKTVYAFFHPTFQEYFTALAIDDWHFFLNHISKDTNQVDASYRIFKSQWREVFLLWLGQEKVDNSKKQEFIFELLNFDFNCWGECYGFYGYQAHFLATMGVGQFKSCLHTEGVIWELTKWGFGYFHGLRQEWILFQRPIQAGSREALRKSDWTKVVKELNSINEILSLAKNCSSPDEASKILKQIDYSNDESEVLNHELLTGGKDRLIEVIGDISNQISVFLGEINSNSLSSKRLRSKLYLQTTEGKEAISSGVSKAITVLTEILKTRQDRTTLYKTASDLSKIDPGNLIVIKVLASLLDSNCNEKGRLKIAVLLGHVDLGNPNSIKNLTSLLQSKDFSIRLIAAHALGKTDSKNADAIRSLTILLDSLYENLNEDNEDTCQVVAQVLIEIDPGNPKAITVIVDLRRSNYSDPE
jgi:energy-coupling factor transporter ATP-binding protein EcfA2